jgi:hypothetical protein
MNSSGSFSEINEWVVAGTSKSYDRQTQNAVYPMTKRHTMALSAVHGQMRIMTTLGKVLLRIEASAIPIQQMEE